MPTRPAWRGPTSFAIDLALCGSPAIQIHVSMSTHSAINPPLSLSPFLHTSLFLHSLCSFLRPFTHPSRCKASPSIVPEITHFRHSRYRIGPPAILDSISHDVAPTTTSAHRSLAPPISPSFRTRTQTHTLPLILRLSLLHSHTLVASQMDSTNRS